MNRIKKKYGLILHPKIGAINFWRQQEDKKGKITGIFRGAADFEFFLKLKKKLRNFDEDENWEDF